MKRLTVRIVNGELVYERDGKPLPKRKVRRYWPNKTGDAAGVPQFAYGPDFAWHAENGGRGRYIGQMAERPGDPDAYCRSQQEAIDKAKRKGWSRVEKAY